MSMFVALELYYFQELLNWWHSPFYNTDLEAQFAKIDFHAFIRESDKEKIWEDFNDVF